MRSLCVLQIWYRLLVWEKGAIQGPFFLVLKTDIRMVPAGNCVCVSKHQLPPWSLTEVVHKSASIYCRLLLVVEYDDFVTQMLMLRMLKVFSCKRYKKQGNVGM